MAIKIRCSECRKKISIDEAFAGGMCRCPYCKALVYVPEGSGTESARARPAAPGARPEAPTAAGGPPPPPGRPAEAPAGGEAPAAPPPPPPPPGAQELEHIPMARPVKIQGVITIILLVLLAMMVAAGVTITLMYVQSGPEQEDIPDDTTPVDPLAISKIGPAIADVKILASPVVYCLDGGSSMRGTFDGARVMTARSVESLGEKMTFTVVLCGESEDKFLSADYPGGGEKGKDAALAFLKETVPSGATDIPRALKAALARKPKTIVLIARKVVDDAAEAAAEARKQGVVIHTIAVDADTEVVASMKKLAETTGGEARAFYGGMF